MLECELRSDTLGWRGLFVQSHNFATRTLRQRHHSRALTLILLATPVLPHLLM